MRKALFFTLVFCMAAIAANAQKAPDFSGKWNLDIAKSELGQQASMIKSQTMTITQAGTSFKVSTHVERNAPATDGPGGGAGNGRAMANPMEQSYTLDGKEVSSERQTPNGPVTTKMKSEQSGNKVVITNTFPTPNGEMKSTTTYELSADGKTLTVTRESARGSAKHVYTKAS
jgi:hypothetical protein